MTLHVFTLRPAGPEHLSDCCQALYDSEQGRRYFGSPAQTEAFLRPGIERGEVVISLNKEGDFIGFIWYTFDGSFHRFPFLQAIAVKPVYRSIGAGSYLMSHFEEEAFRRAPAVFVLASAANPRALRFYKRLLYRQVGRIPGLYLRGIDEIILMKSRSV